jgi:hypothetical protein
MRLPASFRIVVLGSVALLSGLNAQSPGRLTGQVLADETGKPLAGFTVVAVQRVAPSPPVVLRAVADSDGVYAIENAPPGAYAICVTTQSVYLDPCAWGAPVAGVAGGPSQDIRLRLGIPVVVRVVDVDGHAAGRDPNKPGSVVAVTLADAQGRERLVPLTNRGAGIYEYSYLTLPQAALRVKVASGEFLLADDSGSPIDERGHIFAVTTPSAAAAAPEQPRIRPPFTAPRFGPAPVTVLVKIRAKKGA